MQKEIYILHNTGVYKVFYYRTITRVTWNEIGAKVQRQCYMGNQ